MKGLIFELLIYDPLNRIEVSWSENYSLAGLDAFLAHSALRGVKRVELPQVLPSILTEIPGGSELVEACKLRSISLRLADGSDATQACDEGSRSK